MKLSSTRTLIMLSLASISGSVMAMEEGPFFASHQPPSSQQSTFGQIPTDFMNYLRPSPTVSPIFHVMALTAVISTALEITHAYTHQLACQLTRPYRSDYEDEDDFIEAMRAYKRELYKVKPRFFGGVVLNSLVAGILAKVILNPKACLPTFLSNNLSNPYRSK
jgi:hypothetical protein